MLIIFFAAAQCAQGVKGVVCDEPRPHEFPERIFGFSGEAASEFLVQRRKERSALLLKDRDDLLGAVAQFGRGPE